MKNIFSTLTLLCFLVLFCGSSCRKHHLSNPDKPQLPPPTQEGKNTFGCYVNGKPWTPKGFRGETGNLSLDFDPGYKNGIFSIVAYNFNSSMTQQFIIGVRDSLNSLPIPVTLKLNKNSLYSISFKIDTCDYFNQMEEVQSDGSLTITKLDETIERVIISGIFSANLYRPDCDTIRITEGRFDMSLH